MTPRIKICCIQDAAELRTAIDAGADAVGIVGPGLSGPEVRTIDQAVAIAALVPPAVTTFFLTREQDPDVLGEHVRRIGPQVVQLCDAVPPRAYDVIRAASPGTKIVQVIHVTGEHAMGEAREAAERADAVLLDSGSPAGPDPVFGGTGQTHDWHLSARIVAELDVPVWLAGGLRPDNVAEAIRTVRPFGVDLCSGVRRDGTLDPLLAQNFVSNVRSSGT